MNARIQKNTQNQSAKINKLLLKSLPLGAPPTGWEVVRLADVTSFISTGATPRGGKNVYKSEGVSLIRSQNVYDHEFSKHGLAHIDESAAYKLRRVDIQEDDVLLNITGDSVARCCVVPKWTLPARVNQHVAIIRTSDRLNSTFLQKYLSAPRVKAYVLGHDSGGTRKALTKAHIESFLVPLPPLPEQRRIAHILGSLDDRIELNRQMNETLEAMARAIFKSWFVDFDPVRAKVEGREAVGMDADTAALFPSAFQDSPFGEIPEGWEVLPLPEVIEINPRRVLKKGAIAPYLHMENLPKQGHRPYDWTIRKFNSGTKFINGDTLLARITPCIENGKTALVDFLAEDEVGWGSTEYIVLRPKPPLPVEFGYFLSRSDNLRAFAIHNMTGTTGRQRVPHSCFDYYQLTVPTEQIAKRFGEIVQPFMEKIRFNSKQSRTLAEIRETLLPKLLSGEIRASRTETGHV